MCQSAVFKSNQCEKRNPVHQRFDVRNRDGAVDTTLALNYDIIESMVIVKQNEIFRVSIPTR